MMNGLLDSQEMQNLKFNVAEMQTAVCPTCNDHSQFTFCGAQKWPERIRYCGRLTRSHDRMAMPVL